MSDTTLVKVANFEEVINELEYALQDAKELIKEFSNNKDFKENLEGLKDFNTKVTELKDLIANIYKIQESVGNSANSTATNLAQVNTIMENIITTINKFNNNLTKKDTHLQQEIIDIYDNAIKKIKNHIWGNLKELESELKMINETLRYDYELNYMQDIISVKKTQSNIIMFLILIIVMLCSFIYFANKKLNIIQNVTYANYKVLYQQ